MNINSQNQPVTSNILRIISVKGLKQKVVAQKAGYSSQQFSDMLNGRKIIRPLDTRAIAIALEVDANELFKVSGQEEKEANTM
ncbi:MAG: helix-turn-helix domain-containing protein [Lachnospiraceae bacterium]